MLHSTTSGLQTHAVGLALERRAALARSGCQCRNRYANANVVKGSRGPGSRVRRSPSVPARVAASAGSQQDAASSNRPSGSAMAGAAAALAAVGAAAYSVLSTQPQLPPVAQVLGPAAASVVGGPAAALAIAKLLLGDRLHVELHRGRLYLTAGVPSQGPAVQPGSIVVRPTGDVRGNGAFAAAPIPAGTWLGDYTGELLNRAAFYERYADGVGDYAAAIDDEWTIDAVGAVADTARFHPVHMNHSRGRANVRRLYARSQRRISFFTLRDVAPGEELLYDYGRAYWRGREHLELP